MRSDILVDAKGMACPMPIVRAKRALDEMRTGQVMEVVSTDKGSLKDFQAWVKQINQELIKHEEMDGVYRFWVRKTN